jgi:hypothetical protein
MFTTATDIETGIVEAAIESHEDGTSISPSIISGPSGWEFTDTAVLDSKRNEIIEALSKMMGAKLIRKSRALYWDAAHEKRVVCSISKRYMRGAAYWYAYHPKWDEFLGEAKAGFFVLGCMDLPHAFAIPLEEMRRHLDTLNTTTTSKGNTYWHVHLVETDEGVALVLPGSPYLPIDKYRVPI